MFTFSVKCDNCNISTKSLYHLTMSDASIRNFCSYNCVMLFQGQFPKAPILLPEPLLVNKEKRTKTKGYTTKKKKGKNLLFLMLYFGNIPSF